MTISKLLTLFSSILCLNTLANTYAKEKNNTPNVNIQSVINQKQITINKPLIITVTPQYASICKMIGGNFIVVKSLITDNNSNPHNMQITAKYLQMLEESSLIIINGAQYDDVLKQALLILKKKPVIFQTRFIDVSDLVKNDINSKNPHIWFHSKTYRALAIKITNMLSTAMPEHVKEFESNLQDVLLIQNKIDEKIKYIKTQYCTNNKRTVFANEPLLNLLLEELGLEILNEDVQWVCHHGNEPSGKKLFNLLHVLEHHTPDFFIINSQVDNPLTTIIKKYAKKHRISIIYAAEILDMKKYSTCFDWQLDLLNNIEKALQASEKSKKLHTPHKH